MNESRYSFTQKEIGIIAVGVLVIILIAVLLSWYSFSYFKPGELQSSVSLEGYQAVFLDNGQVYFGKVENPEQEYVKLTDIYYIQLNKALQGQDEEKAAAQPDISLIKLGKELHGPTDVMYIQREHILFMENLADDSKVVSAIKQHKGETTE